MKTKPLTVRQALLATRRIWTALAKSGADVKPKSAHEYLHRCPCCELVNEKHSLNADMTCSGYLGECDKEILKSCPLKSLWPNGCENEVTHNISPYAKWRFRSSGVTGRKQAAATIAAACTRLLQGKKVGK